jgi:hypothetical protein
MTESMSLSISEEEDEAFEESRVEFVRWVRMVRLVPIIVLCYKA